MPIAAVESRVHGRAGNPLARGFEFPGQPVDVVHVIIAALGVLAFFVMT